MSVLLACGIWLQTAFGQEDAASAATKMELGPLAPVPELWKTPEARARIAAAQMLHRGKSDAEFRSQCIEDADSCLAAAGVRAPEGYEFGYRGAEDGRDQAVYTRSDGETRTVDTPTITSGDNAPASAPADSGFAGRGYGDEDYFLMACWGIGPVLFPGANCLTGPICDCKEPNKYYSPCTNSYVYKKFEAGVSCRADFGD